MNELAIAYCEKVLERPIAFCEPKALGGFDVMEALWPLNDVFRPVLARVSSVRYRARFERAADRAIEDFVDNGGAEVWACLPPGVWRVLLERHQQWLTVATANEVAGNDIVTRLPADLPQHHWLPALMLSMLHGMKLPWPPDERSQLELPDGDPPASLRRH